VNNCTFHNRGWNGASGFDCPLPFLGEGASFSLEYYSAGMLALALIGAGFSWMTRDWRLRLLSTLYVSLWVTTHMFDDWSRAAFGFPVTYFAHNAIQLAAVVLCMSPRTDEADFGLPRPWWLFIVLGLQVAMMVMIVVNMDAHWRTDWRWRNGLYLAGLLTTIAVAVRHYFSPTYREFEKLLSSS